MTPIQGGSLMKRTTNARLRWRVLALPICFILTLQSTLLAQDATGKVLGTITDQNGAVVPGAKIKVTNTATHISHETTSDKDGNYEVIALPIGTYQVTVEQTGFKKSVSEPQ